MTSSVENSRSHQNAPLDFAAASREATKSSPFFKFSPEIRNLIYREVLCNDDPITVTLGGFSRNGGLLGTCQKVRAEAIGIFYSANTFQHTMRNFNSQPIERLIDTISRAPKMSGMLKLNTYIVWEPNWGNLMNWLRIWYQRNRRGWLKPMKRTGNPGLQIPNRAQDIGSAIIAAMIEILRKMSMLEQPWEAVEGILKTQRSLLVKTDLRWLEE